MRTFDISLIITCRTIRPLILQPPGIPPSLFVFVFESEFFDCFVDCFAVCHDFVFSDAGEFVVRVIRYAFAHDRDAFAVFDFALFSFLVLMERMTLVRIPTIRAVAMLVMVMIALPCVARPNLRASPPIPVIRIADTTKRFCFRRGQRFAAF